MSMLSWFSSSRCKTTHVVNLFPGEFAPKSQATSPSRTHKTLNLTRSNGILNSRMTAVKGLQQLRTTIFCASFQKIKASARPVWVCFSARIQSTRKLTALAICRCIIHVKSMPHISMDCKGVVKANNTNQWTIKKFQ